MTSSRPYLLRALYEWICDNSKTPYIIVAANMPGVQVPEKLVKNDRIVFDLSPNAIDDLLITNVAVTFQASFSGVSRSIFAPIESIQAIYAQENGKGMVFGEEPGGEIPPDNSKFTQKSSSSKKSHLKIVKSD
jgi:stringent starvation protein B